MNRKYALQSLLDGKKIYNRDWTSENEFIDMDNLGNMFSGNKVHIERLSYESGWEIYEEPEEPEKIELPDDNPNTLEWSAREIALRALFNTNEIIKYIKQKEEDGTPSS